MLAYTFFSNEAGEIYIHCNIKICLSSVTSCRQMTQQECDARTGGARKRRSINDEDQVRFKVLLYYVLYILLDNSIN